MKMCDSPILSPVSFESSTGTMMDSHIRVQVIFRAINHNLDQITVDPTTQISRRCQPAWPCTSPCTAAILDVLQRRMQLLSCTVISCEIYHHLVLTTEIYKER
ncbi:hypothetical protein J6590_014983 [Homalodisca vitripennis]|nr:hypothetical protein J6590_014983 [Homalodisca vitripennis]